MQTLWPIIGHSEIGIRVLAISECAPRSGHSRHTTTGITIAAGSVLIFLAQSRCEPKHQLHAFHFGQPIAKCDVEFFSLGRTNAGQPKQTQLAEGQRRDTG